MNRISLKQTRKAPTSYWQEIFQYAEQLCKAEQSVEDIFTKLRDYIKENYSNTKARISMFDSSLGKSKSKMVIAFTHGTSNGGDQIASISENYQLIEKLILKRNNYQLSQFRRAIQCF